MDSAPSDVPPEYPWGERSPSRDFDRAALRGKDAPAGPTKPDRGSTGWNVELSQSGCAPASRQAPLVTPRGPRVLVTVPVRNEALRLIPTIRSLKAAFDESGFEYRLAVAEDGSTDGTKQLLSQLPHLFQGILVQENPHRLGRGKALRVLWSGVSADIYCFTDADLATGPESLVEVVRLVADGWDVVTGSRDSRDSQVNRPPLRSLVSLAYNGLVRFSFSNSIRDFQCGLKAFSARAAREIIPQTVEDSWFWDTEVLVLAHLNGLRIKEVPVHWVEGKARRTPLRRLGSDIYLHGAGLVRLKSRITVASRGKPAIPESIGRPS
jgi:glycosyltransferase involved in cell wall biosynthesis